VVTARRTNHRTTRTDASVPSSLERRQATARSNRVESIGWNRSIDQTDRQTDGFGYGYQKKNAHRRRFQSSRNSRVFFSIDRSDRSIPDRSKPDRNPRSSPWYPIDSIRFDRFDPIDSIRVRFAFDIDSVLIRYRYRFDRTRESIGGFYRSNAHRVAVRRTVRRFRRTVGRSVGRFAFVIHIIGWIHRPHRPVPGDADARTRPTGTIRRAIRRAIRLTDDATDGRTTRIHPSIGTHHPSGRVRRGVTSSVICYL
jgi:hypothetical protein